jgi:hypothetical protein
VIAYVPSNSLFILRIYVRHDSEAQARRGEEQEADPEQFQDPDNETGLFAGTVYEQDDEEADRIYDAVDAKMDERRKTRRLVNFTIHLSSEQLIPAL